MIEIYERIGKYNVLFLTIVVCLFWKKYKIVIKVSCKIEYVTNYSFQYLLFLNPIICLICLEYKLIFLWIN